MKKLKSAFRQGLALPDSFDVTAANSATLKQWDSVAHLQLVIALEDAFGIQLTSAEVVELSNYSAAETILRRHGTWQDA